MAINVAHRVETVRLILRVPHADEAPLYLEAIAASIDHLRPWLMWAQAEQTVESQRERLGKIRKAFEAGENCAYTIRERETGRMLGAMGLHPRIGPGGREIGYWLRADATGRGLATEASAALARVAFEHCGDDRVEIHMEPRNERSAAVPRRLGFTCVETREKDMTWPDGRPRDTMVWRMTAAQFPATEAHVRSRGCNAFDTRGASLLAR
jgi:RimJ/RimL family protein N-acetyltransferase